MKGIIFTEFLELVEAKFGIEVLENMLEMSDDTGVYTAVGSYDHKDLVNLIVSLSKLTKVAVEDLQQVFGRAVFMNLYKSLRNSAPIVDCKTTFQFLRQVENYIHIEVKKLYPDANPPKFNFLSESESTLEFDYHSARCMSHVCLGLVQGCADKLDETLDIKMTNQVDDGSHVRFNLSVV
ncbi:heme NO-binding domain-containing protein [Vibrio marisflavi]|uniref:Heme NO-binding domain-containing protein n=1 Tax=Vibrio marisflavi CECT 7928 TaxID=634439 RepID=A0ABN8E030_9VIBR|nr:heme NO-binding domain-containing protein [Vibrio marisflavi]CAH0536139.1 hypothetical protein VMF7928_00233 [Vibrio marisflavi CECT 7928]